jgi:hypothetical protein
LETVPLILISSVQYRSKILDFLAYNKA